MKNETSCTSDPRNCGQIFGLPHTTGVVPLTLQDAIAGYGYLECKNGPPGVLCPIAQALLAPQQKLLDEHLAEIQRYDVLAATSTYSVQQRHYHRIANKLRKQAVS